MWYHLTHNMGVEVPCNGFVHGLGHLGHDRGDDLRHRVGTNAGLRKQTYSILKQTGATLKLDYLVVNHLLCVIIFL